MAQTGSGWQESQKDSFCFNRLLMPVHLNLIPPVYLWRMETFWDYINWEFSLKTDDDRFLSGLNRVMIDTVPSAN